MNTRPKSVTIIAWIIIVTSLISVPLFLMNSNDPQFKDVLVKQGIPTWLVYIQLGVEIVVRFTCGIGLLKAQNWARYLYLTWGLIGLVIATLTFPSKSMVIPSIIVLGLFAFFLFRPDSEQYFTQK